DELACAPERAERADHGAAAEREHEGLHRRGERGGTEGGGAPRGRQEAVHGVGQNSGGEAPGEENDTAKRARPQGGGGGGRESRVVAGCAMPSATGVEAGDAGARGEEEEMKAIGARVRIRRFACIERYAGGRKVEIDEALGRGGFTG